MWLTNVDQSSPTRRFVSKTADRATVGHVHQPWQGQVVTFLKVILSRKRYLFGSFPGATKISQSDLEFWGSQFSHQSRKHRQIHGFECWPKFNTMCEEAAGKDIAKNLRFYTDSPWFELHVRLGTRGGWNHHGGFVWSWWSGVFWLQPLDFLCRRTLA